MLVSTDIIENIDEIVERAYLDFTFDIIGDKFFTDEQKRQVESLGLVIGRRPLIELLYILVRQRSTPGYKRDKTLNQLLDEIAQTGVLPVINDTNQYTIEHAKAQINESIETSKTSIKKKVVQEILQVNNQFKNEVAVERLTTVPNLQEKTESNLGKLLAGVAGLALVIQPEFVKSFTTALTNMANNTAVDSATTDLEIPGDPKKIKVFKEVINDKALCEWCNAFYTDAAGKPKVYTLEELQKNGTNDGKSKSAWKPVIGPTHPRCRCQLQYIKD